MKFKFVKRLAILGVAGALMLGGNFSPVEVRAAETEWTAEDESKVQRDLQELREAGFSEEAIKAAEEDLRGSMKEAKKMKSGDNGYGDSAGYDPNVESAVENAQINETAIDNEFDTTTETDNEPSSSVVADNKEPSSNVATDTDANASTVIDNKPSSNTVTDNSNQSTEPSSSVATDTDANASTVTDNEPSSSVATDIDTNTSTVTDNESSSSVATDSNPDEVDATTGRTVEELLRTASATAELDGNVVKVTVKPKYNDTVIQSYSLYSNDKRCAFPSVDVSDNKFTCELPEGYSGTYFVIVETSEGTINSNVFGVANEAGNEIEISDTGNDADYTEGNFAVNLNGLPEVCNEGDTVTITISTDIPVKLEFNGVVAGRGVYGTNFDVAVSSNGVYEYRAVNENNEEVAGSIEVNCFKSVEESSSNIGIIIAAVVVILIAVVIILLLLSRKRAKEGANESEITEEDL